MPKVMLSKLLVRLEELTEEVQSWWADIVRYPDHEDLADMRNALRQTIEEKNDLERHIVNQIGCRIVTHLGLEWRRSPYSPDQLVSAKVTASHDLEVDDQEIAGEWPGWTDAIRFGVNPADGLPVPVEASTG